jgi:hypothetical protein
MKTLIFLVIIFSIWMVYEYWRAPLLKENEDGSWTTIKPQKKLKDLWRRRY